MNKTVIIDCDENGQYSVGEEPHESGSEASAEAQGGGEGGSQDQGESGIQMQPAKNIDDAFKMARALFAQGDASNDPSAQAAFAGGYKDVSQGPAGGM